MARSQFRSQGTANNNALDILGRKKEPEEQGRRPTIGTRKEPEVVLDTLMGRRPTMARKKEPEVVLDTLKEGSKFSESAYKSNNIDSPDMSSPDNPKSE